MMRGKEFLENLNKYWATPIIAIVGGLLGLYFNYVKSDLEAEAKKLESAALQINTELAKRESELAEKEFTNNLKIQMYGEVKDAISKDDKELQSAVLFLVNEMLADDTTFKKKLITILMAAPKVDNEVKEQQKEIEQKDFQFISEQKTLKLDPPSSSIYKIDVFYLEDIIDEAKPRAEKIVATIERIYPNYNVRLRRLPRTINAKKGYSISVNEIRFEKAEKAIAETIKAEIEQQQIFQKEQLRLKQKNSSGTVTDNYISIFVRNK